MNDKFIAEMIDLPWLKFNQILKGLISLLLASILLVLAVPLSFGAGDLDLPPTFFEDDLPLWGADLCKSISWSPCDCK